VTSAARERAAEEPAVASSSVLDVHEPALISSLGKSAGSFRLDSRLQASLKSRKGHGDRWHPIEVMRHQDQAERYRDDGHRGDPEGEKAPQEDGHFTSCCAIT
jgi:hypothetical protein